MPTTTNQNVAVVMVPLPAQGHLNQLLHLSRLLSTATSAAVYYAGAATHLRQAKLRLHGWDPSAVNFIEFSTPSFQTPPPNPHAPTNFPSHLLPSFSASTHLRKPFHSFITELSTKFTRIVVVFDSLMAYVVQDIGSIPNAEAYSFRSISAFTVQVFLWDAAGRPAPPPDAAVMEGIPSLDGMFSPEFSEFSSLQRAYRKVCCTEIYNSCREIEGLYLDLMEKKSITGVEKIWAIGPFNPISSQSSDSSSMRHKCLEWLDDQEPDSVLFVSFGTTTTFPDEQIQELAYGLERSGQKFIWVVREADKGDIFAGGEARRVELPLGFEERVRERGIVVREWAPQLEILGHSSVGGFMSHCGWNSCMESISNGVPMLTWPMHSDQPTNAFLAVEVLRIGLRVVDWVYRNEVVAAERVAEVVRRLMAGEEGGEVRRRAKELGASVKKTGENNLELNSFIHHITR